MTDMCKTNASEEGMIDRMLQRVEWIHPDAPLYSGDNIAFRDNGVLVRGVVAFSPRSILVTIKAPIEGLSEQDTIAPNFPVIFTTHPDEESPASPAGIDRARRLILKLYYSSGKTV